MIRILPPVLVALLIILMIALKVYAPFMAVFPEMISTYIGIGCILLGAAITLTAASSFFRVKTNIHPFKNPDILVESGMFSITRNPMYLGFLSITLGAALLCNDVSCFIGPVMFFLAANFYYIPFEERAAAAQFGDAYEAYKQKVRRWL